MPKGDQWGSASRTSVLAEVVVEAVVVQHDAEDEVLDEPSEVVVVHDFDEVGR